MSNKTTGNGKGSGEDNRKKPTKHQLAPASKVAVPLKPPMKQTVTKPAISSAGPAGGSSTVTAGGVTSGSTASALAPAPAYPSVVPPGGSPVGAALSDANLLEYKNMSLSGTPENSTPKDGTPSANTPRPSTPKPGDSDPQPTVQTAMFPPTAVPAPTPMPATAPRAPGPLLYLASRDRNLEIASQEQVAAYADPSRYAMTATGIPVNVTKGVAQIKGYNGIFITKLPHNVSPAKILDWFGRAGSIVGHEFPPDTSKRGWLIIRYSTIAQAQAAIEMFDNTKYLGKTIAVKIDKNSEIYEYPPPAAPGSSRPATTIYPASFAPSYPGPRTSRALPPMIASAPGAAAAGPSGPFLGARIRIRGIPPKTSPNTVQGAMGIVGVKKGSVRLYPGRSPNNDTQMAVVEFPSTVQAIRAVEVLQN